MRSGKGSAEAEQSEFEEKRAPKMWLPGTHRPTHRGAQAEFEPPPSPGPGSRGGGRGAGENWSRRRSKRPEQKVPRGGLPQKFAKAHIHMR